MIYTLVPLGNPGKNYETTRHNAARIVLSLITKDLSCEVFVPKTFMNESGVAIKEYLKYHSEREIIIMYDDKDLPIGTIRISHDRGDGGHNGLKNIIEQLGKKDFIRIRIGIAPKETDGKTVLAPSGEMVQKFVLENFTDEEIVSLKGTADRVYDAVNTIVKEGFQKAMDLYN